MGMNVSGVIIESELREAIGFEFRLILDENLPSPESSAHEPSIQVRD